MVEGWRDNIGLLVIGTRRWRRMKVLKMGDVEKRFKTIIKNTITLWSKGGG
jgi:hypothetical protein